MLKRFVARLLIIAQVYGCFFQGIAHAATLVDESSHQRHLFEETSLLGINQPEKLKNFEDDVHISKFTYLYSEFNEKLGQLQFSLGDGLTAPTVFTIPTVNDPTDSFNYGGVTVNSQSTYFTFQGLRVSVNKAGIMVVQGSQTEQNPIFLASNRAIILNDVKASTLSVTSQKIVNTGISAIECLSFEGQSVGVASFINAGKLTSKDLFLNNLNSDNRGTISSTNFGIMGELKSSGVIESDELILGENASLKLEKASRADIKTLFLSKASHLQNQQQEENVLNIGVLHSLGSLGGALTNFGTMAIAEVATGSAFQAITNRHFMGIAQGDVKVETFTNSKAFGLNQGSLLVENGTNSGILNANDLKVKTEFTNNKDGFVAVSLVSGAGEIINQGIIGAHDKDLALDVKTFTNSTGGSVNAKSITGLANLAKFTNAEEASIEVTQTLGFDQTTKVINQGDIKAHDLTLFGKQTTQEGDIRVSNLEITGGGEFKNLGDIEVEQCLTLGLDYFTNEGNLSTDVINGHQQLRCLSNYAKASFKVRDGPLDLAETTLIGNLGIIEAKSLSLHTGKTTLYQSGTLKASNITLTGDNPFTNSGQIFASEKLSLNLSKFVNENKIVSPLIDISKITELTNAKGGVIDTQGSDLKFDKVKVVNEGTLNAGNYLFRNGSLVQGGKIEGKFLRFEGSTAITTTDGQTINLTDKLEAAVFGRPWDIRGKINARSFTSYSPIDLYGNLTVAEQFFGDKTVVHSGAKLISKNLHFSTNNKIGAVIHAGGELQADTLSGLGGSSSFTINGQAFIKKSANIGILKVGEHGKLQGHKGSSLSLSLDEEAEIAGLVDVDVLSVAKKIALSQKGVLVSRKKTELKSSLDIAKDAGAELHDLKFGSYTAITNNGKLKLIGQEKASFMLLNRGQAYIEAKEKTWISENKPSPKAIEIFLQNYQTGHLTLKKGEFDLSSDEGRANSQNAGTLVNESSSLWFGGFKNTGVWTSPGGSVIRNYSGQDMGDFRVDGDLRVRSLGDRVQTLEGFRQTQARKLIMHANRLALNQEQQFTMPLEFHIQDTLSVQAKLTAPAIEVNAKTLALGSANGGWGVLSAYRDGINITVDAFDNRFGHIIAMQDAQIIVNGDNFVNGAYVLDPNHVETGEHIIVYPRKRNGAAISVGRDLRIRVRGQNALLNNHYGLMQADGYLNLFSQKQITNMAGIISSKGGGLLSAREIKVKRDEISRKPHPTYGKWCDGHYYDKKGCQVRDSCSGGNQCTEIFYYREQSDEGWINIGGKDLEIDTDSLEVLASHIVSKGRLFLKRQRIDLSKHEGGELQGIKGVLVQSRQDRMAYEGMCGRGRGGDLAINKAGIFSYSDMELQSHGLKIEGISTIQTMDMVKALAQTAKMAGFNVTSDQARDLLIDIVSGARFQANEPQSLIAHQKGKYLYNLPHEKNEAPTYGPGPMPVLTQDYATFDRNIAQNTNLQHTVSKRVLESLLDTLVLKALCNPQRSDFSKNLYESSQAFAINNMKQRLLQNFEAKTEEEAEKIVAVRYNQLIPITYEDMSVYAKDVTTCAKQMLLFELGANYRATQKLKRMEDDLDQEICDLRPQVFVPKKSVPTEKTTATVHSDSFLNHHATGNMTMRGEAGYRSYGGTNIIEGNFTVEALAMRQGDGDNFHEQAARPVISNLGDHNRQSFIVTGDVRLTGALIDTGGEGNEINFTTPGRVIDTALGLSSRSTTHTQSKRSHTVTVVDETIMHPTEYFGSGALSLQSNIGVTLQAPEITCKVSVEAPYLELPDAHNFRAVQSTTETRGKSGLFGGSEKKTVASKMHSFFSKGGKLRGPEFIARVRQFSATNPLFATHADITATEKAEIKTGTDQSQSCTQSTFKGIVWNKCSVSTEKHMTHSNPTFEHNVYIHSPEVIVERARGSQGTFEKIISDSELIFKDVDDVHEHQHQSQQSLTAGASLLISLAVTLATANPAAATSIQGAMLSAAYGTLCSQTAVCLVENGGNFGKAMDALGERDIGKSMLISAASAGLTKGLGDKLGITGSTAFDNLAKKYLLQSAINTTLAVTIDGQKPEDAIRQGLTSAAINTLAAYAASKIGGAYFDGKVDPFSHKLLHGLLGAASGATSSMILGGDIGRGAMSGAFGGILAETIADAFSPDQAEVDRYVAEHPGVEKETIKNHFMEKAQATTNWAAFTSALGAFGVGLDASVAHSTARNAVDHNMLPHVIMWLAVSTAVSVEWCHFTKDVEAEGVKAALEKLGIRVVTEDLPIGMAVATGVAAAPMAFEVCGVACKTLREAIAIIRANPLITKEVGETCQALEHNMPKLQKMLDGLKEGYGKTREYVKDQFNYREFFEAERLRLEGGTKPKTYKGGKYAEAEDVKVNIDPKNRSAHELYKQELQREQALRDRIYNVEKQELPEIKDLQDIGFKGEHSVKLKRNNMTGKIQANTDSQDSASYIYRQQVRKFQNEVDVRGLSTTQRIKAPGSTLETVFEDGSRVLLRAESKTGVAKVEITDTYRNIHEKITPISKKEAFK